MEVLVDLLSERVGSPISVNNLAGDLEVSPHTVKRWLGLLESLFVIFIVTPRAKNIAKSILKEPKVYFYDTGRVQAGSGARLENIVGLHLLKENHFREDTLGTRCSLHYLRNKEKKEVDFICIEDKKVRRLVEVKESDSELSPSLRLFSERLGVNETPGVAWQVVGALQSNLQRKNIRIIRAEDFLLRLEC